NHPFEDIEVKENALELLESALKKKRQQCMIGTGSMTDPYIPLELELKYVRRALELIDKYGFGVTLQTKSDRVLRDMDLLEKINRKTKCVVQMTLTNVDDELSKKLEPGVCTTTRRFEVLKEFRDAGIPTVVWLDPILPFINDTKENVSGLLDMCVEAKVKGIICFGMGLTLREGNREYFYRQLDLHFPGVKEKYIKTYGNQYEIASPNNDDLMRLFHKRCKDHGIMHDNDQIFGYLRQFEEKEKVEQLSLFDLM
ncbi:MAG: radical SAM protein, partial [Lachnospiraceae bacterium]|nr:radical SAM protein [Lachnospiraceae bacterium]